MNEKIGILIPLYNNEKLIKRCLKSILNQTYSNLEIIIIDDGSTDNSFKICEDFVGKDERFKIYRRKNKGVAFTRNEAIKMCTAKYFIFLDSDDCIDKDYIETLYNIMKYTKTDLVSSTLFNFKREDELLNKENNPVKTQIVNKKEGLKRLLYQYDIQNGPTCKLYKRELFDKIIFPEGRIYEDLATIYKVVNECNTIAITNYNGYNYFYNIFSITKKGFRKEEIVMLEYGEEIYSFIQKKYKEKELLLAAKNLLVSQCIFLACKIPMEKQYKNVIKKIKKYINLYRMNLLKDRETHFKTKLYLLISLLGIRNIKLLYKFECVVKGRK